VPDPKMITPEEAIARLDHMPRDAAGMAARLRLCRDALAWEPAGHRSIPWARIHSELGTCLMALHGRDPAHQEDAIRHFEQALCIYTPAGHLEQWIAAQYNLALAYWQRAAGDPAANLETAIRLLEAILAACPPGQAPLKVARVHYDLARLYYQRSQADPGRYQETAITHAQNALQIWQPEVHLAWWAKAQDLLGTLYRHRWQGEAIDNLRRARQCHQDALAALERAGAHDTRERARIEHNLGTTLLHLQRLEEDREGTQAQAISHLEQALHVRTREAAPQEWAETQHNLAVLYVERLQGDRAGNLRQAIACLEEVAQVRPREAFPRQWAMVQQDLGAAYLESTYGGRSENIERAIVALNKAIAEYKRAGMAHMLALARHNLAVAQGERLSADRVTSLSEAVASCREALQAVDRRNLDDWSLIKTSLAGMLWRLATFERDRDLSQAEAHLEEAIAHGKETIAVLEKHSLAHRLAFACYNLANAYGDRIAGQKADNQEKAISYLERALGFYAPDRYPERWANAQADLGAIYGERVRGPRADNVRQAIVHLEQALQVFTVDAFPIYTLRVARNLGNLYFDLRRWREAHQVYAAAIEAADNLYRASLLRAGKEAELAESPGLYHRAAYAFAQDGHLEQAAATLEQGRARLLTDALERDRADLRRLAQERPDLYEPYQRIAREMEDLAHSELGTSPAGTGYDHLQIDLADGMRSASDRLAGVVEQIRLVPSYQGFLARPSFEQVQQAARPGWPLVYLAATAAGGMALLVHAQGVERAWLDELTDRSLSAQVQRWFGAYQADLEAYRALRKGKRERRPGLESLRSHRRKTRREWLDTIDSVTRWLWDAVVSRPLGMLQRLGAEQATWIPVGSLGFLPLHAAWHADGERPGRQYAVDRLAFAYAPSARGLTGARQLAGLVGGEAFFAVADPDGSLKYTQVGVREVAAYFERPFVASREHATRNTVLSKLPQKDVYHFYCHGRNEWERPLDSVLELFGRQLAVRDLLALASKPRARLAFLAACESGTIGNRLPDEAVGLGTAFMQVGTAGVISPLWSVPAQSTAFLAKAFYSRWKGEGEPPVQALRAAQCWLRDQAQEGRWSHPFYWAGFTLAGV
jgi:CHAT domain-containing protein